MTSLALPSVSTAVATRELEMLLNLQMKVAKRADALARRRRTNTRAGDRRLWLRAESEVFDHAGNAAH